MSIPPLSLSTQFSNSHLELTEHVWLFAVLARFHAMCAADPKVFLEVPPLHDLRATCIGTLQQLVLTSFEVFLREIQV